MKSLALFVVFFMAPFAIAAPKVDSLFPAGGQRGTSIEVTANGAFGIWPVQAWTSHPGITISPTKTIGRAMVEIAADVPCGVHWLRLFDKTGASDLRPFLVNQLPEIEEAEPNDDFEKPQNVAQTSVIVNGRLAKNDDVDHFAVNLKKGQTLVAAVEAHRTLHSPMDGVLQIVSTDGFVLAQNDDYYDIDPLLAFEAPKDGVFLVRLFCFPAKPDSRVGFFGKETCIYRLTLTTGPFVDRTWPRAVERGQPAEVEFLGWNIPADRSRSSVSSKAADERVLLHPPEFANGAWVTSEPNRTLTDAEELGTPPVSVSGRLKRPGDRAVFSFVGAKGKALSIAIESRSQDLPLDAVLSIRNAAGKTIQKVRSAKLNVDPTIDFSPPEDGVYTLEVRDLHDDGGPRHLFLVRIRTVQPDFSATTAADRFTGKASQPIEIPISLEFRNGMKGTPVVYAQGLPKTAGIELIPGKDSKKSTVRIYGLKAGFNGTVKIFAQFEGQPERVLHAMEWNQPYLWITNE